MLPAQEQAAAHLEAGGVFDGDRPVEPVGIVRQGGGTGRILEEYGLLARADEPYVVPQMDGVAHPIGAGKDLHGPSAERGYIV